MSSSFRRTLRRQWQRAILASSGLVVVACGGDAITNVNATGNAQTIVVGVGQLVDITFHNVGPGAYDSPPTLSSDGVSFMGEDDVPPYNPGGVTQRFRFRTLSKGDVVVSFRRDAGSFGVTVVEDTIRVR